MNWPLASAITTGLGGFAFWVWITGPGTSVPNALLAFAVGVISGRLGWRLAARDARPEDTAPKNPPPPGASEAHPWNPERASRSISLPDEITRWQPPIDPFGRNTPEKNRHID